MTPRVPGAHSSSGDIGTRLDGRDIDKGMIPRFQARSIVPHCCAAKLAADTTHESFENPTYLIESRRRIFTITSRACSRRLAASLEAFKLSEMNSKGSITQCEKSFLSEMLSGAGKVSARNE